MLYTFAGSPDGANPSGNLIQDAVGNFYGMTTVGGTAGKGVAFELDTAGKETVLYSFMGPPNDGANPFAGLVRDAAGNLYGTTYYGGAANVGTIFKLDPTGKETVLYSFTGGTSDGANPQAGLIEDAAGNFYGTTYSGGTANLGTIFKLDTTGKETVLYNFMGGSTDGANPFAGLLQDSARNLYGTTVNAGGGNVGTVFKLDPTGKETVLYSFVGGPRDGANPTATLIQDSAGNFYGTTSKDGNGHCVSVSQTQFVGCGTVFKLDTTGKETTVYGFAGGTGDGSTPLTSLVQDGAGNLFGTTPIGGANGKGIIFEIDPTGKETVLYNFTGGTDEGYPSSPLLLDSSGQLFGTTNAGGQTQGPFGVIFEFYPRSPSSFDLSVMLAGSGSGTVTSNPAGINCGSTCSAGFAPGTSVALTAAPGGSSNFAGWSGTCSGTSTCTVTLNQSASETATFVFQDFSLTPASASLSLQPGSQATDVMTLSGLNGPFSNPIELACAIAGSAPMPTCGLSQSSVTPGSNSASSTLTVTAPTGTAMHFPANRPDFSRFVYAVCVPPLFAFVLLGAARDRQRTSWSAWALFVLIVFFQAGCGGSSGESGRQTPTNYTVTVTATSGALKHTSQITVTVQ